MKSDRIRQCSDEDEDHEYTNQMTMRIGELNSAPKQAGLQKNGTSKRPKLPKNRSQLGSDFVPPDGGWGWMVVLAAGCSNVSMGSSSSAMSANSSYVLLSLLRISSVPSRCCNSSGYCSATG